jgi:hypothetical protein
MAAFTRLMRLELSYPSKDLEPGAMARHIALIEELVGTQRRHRGCHIAMLVNLLLGAGPKLPV